MESRFEDLKQSSVFENMVLLLEIQTWPTENINEFGDEDRKPFQRFIIKKWLQFKCI